MKKLQGEINELSKVILAETDKNVVLRKTLDEKHTELKMLLEVNDKFELEVAKMMENTAHQMSELRKLSLAEDERLEVTEL